MSEANALNQDQKPVSKFASLLKWRYASLVILSVMLIAFQPVSYTHLDVYKRQVVERIFHIFFAQILYAVFAGRERNLA